MSSRNGTEQLLGEEPARARGLPSVPTCGPRSQGPLTDGGTAQKPDITATTVSLRAGFPCDVIVIAQRYFTPTALAEVITFSVNTFGWLCGDGPRLNESVPFTNSFVTFATP